MRQFISCEFPAVFLRTTLSLTAVLLMLVGCASLNPVPKNPDVKLVGLRMLPAQNLLEQRIAIDLKILNPNDKDLSIRAINYSIGIENIKVLSGASNNVPSLKSFQETPVTLEVSTDILQVLRLAEELTRNGISDNVNYNFAAVIDFSAWLPSMHVDKKGAVPLGKLRERLAN